MSHTPERSLTVSTGDLTTPLDHLFEMDDGAFLTLDDRLALTWFEEVIKIIVHLSREKENRDILVYQILLIVV